MSHRLSTLQIRLLRLTLAALFMMGASVKASEDALHRAFHESELKLHMFYRFEYVDDDLRPGGVPLDQARASTLRTALKAVSGAIGGFNAALEIENITEVGADDYNDGSNGKTRYATVVDPTDTEVNQAYLQYQPFEHTRIRGGRQAITYRKAPFHRFVGTILWRQNWQTHDALTINSAPFEHANLNYAYVWNVNRIFGDDAPEPLSEFDSNSHLLNFTYDGWSLGKLETYAYLLDFDNADGFSTNTFGARWTGRLPWPASDSLSFNYAAEYAHQTDAAQNPADIDADYVNAAIGFSYKPQSIIDQVGFKFSYELLSGDGGADRFVTILGTNHAFQGWADRFLITPGDGIEDFIYSANVKAYGFKFIVAYHDLQSDNDNYDYGSELNLQLTRPFLDHYLIGLKYAHYDADRNATNIARNAAQSRDVTKTWVFAQLKF